MKFLALHTCICVSMFFSLFRSDLGIGDEVMDSLAPFIVLKGQDINVSIFCFVSFTFFRFLS